VFLLTVALMGIGVEMPGTDVSPRAAFLPSMGFEKFRRFVFRQGQREAVSVYQDRHVVVRSMLVGLEVVLLRLEHHLGSGIGCFCPCEGLGRVKVRRSSDDVVLSIAGFRP